MDVYCVPSHPECAAFEIGLCAAVQTIIELVQKSIAADDLAFFQSDNAHCIVIGIAHTIDAGYRGDDDDVSPPT